MLLLDPIERPKKRLQGLWVRMLRRQGILNVENRVARMRKEGKEGAIGFLLPKHPAATVEIDHRRAFRSAGAGRDVLDAFRRISAIGMLFNCNRRLRRLPHQSTHTQEEIHASAHHAKTERGRLRGDGLAHSGSWAKKLLGSKRSHTLDGDAEASLTERNL
jgi:hypothetical protein